jgi:hypothetical protein
MQRLILTREQLSIQSENLSAAGRRIGNPNAAPSGADFALLNLLVQSGAAMLAQAARLSTTGIPERSLRLGHNDAAATGPNEASRPRGAGTRMTRKSRARRDALPVDRKAADSGAAETGSGQA